MMVLIWARFWPGQELIYRMELRLFTIRGCPVQNSDERKAEVLGFSKGKILMFLENTEGPDRF